MHARRYGGHDELGHVNIDLNTLPVNTPVDQWYALESSDDDRPYLECGHLHVTVEILVNPNQARENRLLCALRSMQANPRDFSH
jgi:hypothetical protein